MTLTMFTRSIELKKRLQAGEVTIGGWLSFSSADAAEIMAGVGFDWLVIDTEHAPFTLERLETVLMAFNGRSTTPIVRVPWNDRVMIKQVLDLGAEGILVPQVGSVEEAEAAIAACTYVPDGGRGFGPRRASDYYRQTAEYIRTANTGVLVALQIEHIKAVEEIRHIAAVPGIDVIVLGPMDLSGSMGLLGQLQHPQVVAAIEKVMAEAKRVGIPVGVPIDAGPQVLLEWAARGCQFVFSCEDHSMLRRSATDTLAQFRQLTAGKA
jgi:2-keto-3-deoxy-L-rhamnonate aldolase RhmA